MLERPDECEGCGDAEASLEMFGGDYLCSCCIRDLESELERQAIERSNDAYEAECRRLESL